jgi:hypothetical protein
MQNNNRLGCLTGTGIFAALITIALIVGFEVFSGNQMFTAGALNAMPGESIGGVTSHADISECSACHTEPWSNERMADRCAKCHTDIAAQMFDVAKLHGAIMQKNSAFECRDCHPEHRGSTASLTEMKDNTFPHEALGYSLEGHKLTATRQPFTCKDCHGQDITTFAPDSCDSCHRQMDIAFTQAHVLAYGTDCLACHDGVDRFGDDFDHNKLSFQLNGKHAEATCTACHLDARSVADLQSLPQDCYSCHQADDAHAGSFGKECGACHSPDAWKPAKFDHNLAAFRLEGKHAKVACEKCHVNNAFKGTPSDCYSCHKQDDAHNGQFGTDCSTCHTPKNWDDANFDHSKTNFPLTGGHAKVKCEQCHHGGTFTGLTTECVSCHEDPAFHAGAFGTNCATCHTIFAWTPAGFKIQHPQPQAEEGGNGVFHGGATCRQCHPTTVQQATCTACHEGGIEGGGGGDD